MFSLKTLFQRGIQNGYVMSFLLSSFSFCLQKWTNINFYSINNFKHESIDKAKIEHNQQLGNGKEKFRTTIKIGRTVL